MGGIDKCTRTLVDSPKNTSTYLYGSTLSTLAWNPSKNANAGGIDKCTCTLVDSPRQMYTYTCTHCVLYLGSSFYAGIVTGPGFISNFHSKTEGKRRQNTLGGNRRGFADTSTSLRIMREIASLIKMKGGICKCTRTHVHIDKCTRTHVHIFTDKSEGNWISLIKMKESSVLVPGVRHQKYTGAQNRQNDSQRAKIDRFCKRFWQRLQKLKKASIAWRNTSKNASVHGAGGE